MRFWACLYAGEEKEVMIDGVSAMLKIAMELLTKPSKRTWTAKLIQEADLEGEDDQETPSEAIEGNVFSSLVVLCPVLYLGWLLSVANVFYWMVITL